MLAKQRDNAKFYDDNLKDVPGITLLERDKRELLTFEENLGKFNMNSGLDQMLGKKLEQQKRKVSVKQAILKDLRDSNK